MGGGRPGQVRSGWTLKGRGGPAAFGETRSGMDVSKGGSRFLPAHPVTSTPSVKTPGCFQNPRGEGMEGRGRGAAAGRRTAAEKAAACIADACHP